MLYGNFYGHISIEEPGASCLNIGEPHLVIPGYAAAVVGGILPPRAPENVLRAVSMALDPKMENVSQSRGILLMDIR